jgi:tetraacyldisaccharide 4'-kinase
MNSATCILLKPAGYLYGTVMTIRNMLFEKGILKIWKAPLPVVSVGNITTGGTGKTPMVDWIVRFYRQEGIRTAIISRGYKRSTRGVQLVSDGQTILLGSREAGDETVMLAANNPDTIVIVAENRKDGVNFLLRYFPDRLPGVLILDDAFQHRRMGRDLDIVVINSREPFSHGKMLPEGSLREPLGGIERADLVIVNKINDDRQVLSITGELRKMGLPFVKARIKKGSLVRIAGDGTAPASTNLKVIAFAGIGSPGSFVQSLEELGMDVVSTRFFRDHEPFSAIMVKELVHEAKLKELCLVTTEKDYYRLLGCGECLAILSETASYFLKIEPDIYEGTLLLTEALLSVAATGNCSR